jgi:hypothetical protein
VSERAIVEHLQYRRRRIHAANTDDERTGISWNAGVLRTVSRGASSVVSPLPSLSEVPAQEKSPPSELVEPEDGLASDARADDADGQTVGGDAPLLLARCCCAAPPRAS